MFEFPDTKSANRVFVMREIFAGALLVINVNYKSLTKMGNRSVEPRSASEGRLAFIMHNGAVTFESQLPICS